ncbi:MAG: GIY-YIG nuclease family protein [Lachnospiraceae bacterium]|jgi:putative endonuclease|nr:GIY-YIG nuclease family protein [Lachnospiraceae bacterium]MCH4069984.1 GIY-YIG nuclease family protein [Lachnospiraceae bacterium]MCH4108663.1 GIY-YIG nuclease family protein [Lachnospiraceae bacterium]MCI1302814.1 GIY-YIG nuclease family protein [Lachnospiraceae bacterium]MCI1332049.1 GIY-YIG nuclease family protein [Lachnospiraceae bacterium]
MSEPYYVYLLRCHDGTLYCGSTNNLEHRVKAHNSGKGAKYTKARRPVCLVYSEELSSKSEALRREAAVKKLTRQQKLALIKSAGNPRGKEETA